MLDPVLVEQSELGDATVIENWLAAREGLTEWHRVDVQVQTGNWRYLFNPTTQAGNFVFIVIVEMGHNAN